MFDAGHLEHPERPDLPSSVAQLDQLDATLKDLAPVLARYKGLLLELGFERAEAVDLVLDVQARTLILDPPDDEDPDGDF